MRGSALYLALCLCAAPAMGADVQRVLFIGNSYTYGNDLPNMYRQLASSLLPGATITVDSDTAGGRRLEQAVEAGSVIAKLDAGNFDFLVLQEQSIMGAVPGVGFYAPDEWKAVRLRSEAAIRDVFTPKATKAGAKVIFFASWGRRETEPNWGFNSFLTMQRALSDGYAVFADIARREACGDVATGRAGEVFKKMYEHSLLTNAAPSTDTASLFYQLYTGDGSHPSVSGSYAIAWALFKAMNGNTNTFNDATTYKSSLSTELASQLAGFAGQVWQENEGIAPEIKAIEGYYPTGTMVVRNGKISKWGGNDPNDMTNIYDLTVDNGAVFWAFKGASVTKVTPSAAEVTWSNGEVLGNVNAVCPKEDTPSPAGTTAEPTSVPPTEAPSTSAPPTTAPLTSAPLTNPPSTTAPLTDVPRTDPPSTMSPPTAVPQTANPATPPTAVPPTAVPTSVPQTNAPLTMSPPTTAPLTEAPRTYAPPTMSPPTAVPQTANPNTPPTAVPPTAAPTSVPLTYAPDTNAPPTAAPPTMSPPTAVPQTANPNTPPTAVPPTAVPTSVPQTSAPETNAPPTMAPPTAVPQTANPNTPPTAVPPTAVPTSVPQTANPATPPTAVPPTAVPTSVPQTKDGDTMSPPTNAPLTPAPATDAPLTDTPPSTLSPPTAGPTANPDTPPTQMPQTANPDTPPTAAPETANPDTPPTAAPQTANPDTPPTEVPDTANPDTPPTPAPLTPAPVPETQEGDTMAPLTSAPPTPAPTGSTPRTGAPVSSIGDAESSSSDDGDSNLLLILILSIVGLLLMGAGGAGLAYFNSKPQKCSIDDIAGDMGKLESPMHDMEMWSPSSPMPSNPIDAQGFGRGVPTHHSSRLV